MEPSEKYPVFDPTGKVKEWLETGRGVAVWSCQALDSAYLGTDTLTPGDQLTAPGWRYGTKPARILGPTDVVFYRRVSSLREWSDTPQGWRAARAWAERWNDNNGTRTAPIGTILERLTLERHRLESVADFHGPETGKRDDGRPIVCRFVVAAVLWSAIVKAAPVVQEAR